ncbi:hypothetical protein [Pseudomonas syringae]|uniref:hypothetical protein n=1 Tax=Pseudomonas syringae TaxID=317 RepID=UPI0006E53412|nr:hypothetical protein [Pseudomonas syringae]KPY38899.1 Uncharacterized protein ALO48_02874 [Pseudomonas syringae pv. rhaphiolepidis]KWS44008.1 hypothetical protein AL060_14320 [Pseudomonas syringae pv. rhaphiolepidis]
MLVKIADFPDDLAEALKPETGTRTASKAVLIAAQRYPGLVSQVKRQQFEISQLRDQLSHMQLTMKSLNNVCRQISELAGQGDIFSDPS